MRVLMVEPGMAPYEKEINGLEEMQAAVGGLITASYPFAEPVALVSNDESIFLGMPFNRSVEGGYQENPHQIATILPGHGGVRRIRYAPENEAELARIIMEEHRWQTGKVKKPTAKRRPHPGR